MLPFSLVIKTLKALRLSKRSELSWVFVAGSACMFRQASGDDGMVRTRAPYPTLRANI